MSGRAITAAIEKATADAPTMASPYPKPFSMNTGRTGIRMPTQR